MIVKGPRFLSASFLEGLVVWKYLALIKAWSPILKSGAGVCLASMGPWYCSCTAAISSEELVEGVKIDGVFLSLFGGKVLFWVDRDVGVVALVGKKGRDISGSVRSIVV